MEPPWTVVGRSGRRPGFSAVSCAPPGASSASPVYFHTPAALHAAVSVHLHALSRNPALVSSLWRHLQSWHAGLSLPVGSVPGLACVGLGSVSCHGPSGSPVIQLSLLLLLQRLAACLAAPSATLPSAEALGREVEGSSSSSSSEGGGLQAPAVEAVDPCFTALDVALLGSVGVRALSQPWAGLPSGAAGPTILFMPHCAGTLYTAALASFAWVAGGEGQGALPQACLIGNCFRDYVERRQRSAAAEEAPPAWGPGLRQAVLESSSSSSSSGSGAAAGGIEDRLPPYALDALVAVYHRCCSSSSNSPSQGAEGPVWRLQCTQLEPLVAPSARGEGPGTGTAYSHALSSTAVHTVEWLQGE
jgi:hypothetical protein